jgi:hypothetical protein
MKRSTRYALLAGCLALWPAFGKTPRSPLGVYAYLGIKETTARFNQNLSGDPCAPVNDTKVTSTETYFVCLYQHLLENNSVSGIAFWGDWAHLNPNPPGSSGDYDWSLVDDLFTQVADWNRKHAGYAPKTVQLVATPGFNSPDWLKTQLFSCNFLFEAGGIAPPPQTACGKVTFSGFIEGGRDLSTDAPIAEDLPLPWDPTYKAAWKTFLTALNARYGSKSTLVSISVAGPSSSSEEMMLPGTKDTKSAPQIGGYTPEQMWEKLLEYNYSDPTYYNCDKAFIEEWENAINMYGSIFSDITLIMTTGGALPHLADTGFTVPTALTAGCPQPNMDCAAETTILAYFMESKVGGANAKSTQTDGMKAGGSTNNDLGVPLVKLISYSTDLYTLPSKRILAGSQFAKSFSMNSKSTVDEGSNKLFPNPSPEQAEFNVLSWFFEDTLEGSYFGTVGLAERGDNGSDPLNYLQVNSIDVLYATKNASNEASVVINGNPVKMTAQTLLNSASEALGNIAEKP